jgi:formate/nitrite transporter
MVTIDTIMPAAMAERAEATGIRRANADTATMFALAVLAGAFISFGAIIATTVSAGSFTITTADGVALSATLPYGVTKLLTGAVFSLGLILVIVAGAELFTGSTMIVMAWASRKVTTRGLLRNWAIAFTGNCVGGLATAGLMLLTRQYTFGGGAIGLAALSIANSKAGLDFVPALALGIMCNVLVCLTVWMCYGARTSVDRVMTIVPPITAFVAAGFEHCIANAYYIPIGLFIKGYAPEEFWHSIGKTPADYPALTWVNFVFGNMLPVTLGNIIGGAVLVAAVYWFIYLRQRTAE